ncbi:septum formation family protein [Nocardioides plantarum]|uniref:Septum formation family protein n=1 Tax=Nocardioides plantarum TaxID=29299 RepID=A0ABV5K4C9_9ACTN|nr:septum formation family protein [Nocardioides plantarum]
MTRSPLRALVGALLAAAVTGSVLTASLTSPADAATPKPEVGDCHSLTYVESRQASDTDPRISCERTHTSRTIAVKNLPGSSFHDATTLAKAGYRACAPALATELGSSASARAQSAYDFVYFAPTKAEIKAGARWVRCDVVLVGVKTFLALPAAKTPALGAAPHTARLARCIRATSKAVDFTACSTTHNYRAQGTVTVSGSKYPARSRFLKIAAQRCPAIAGEGSYSSWPSQWGWVLGKERQLVCYGRD